MLHSTYANNQKEKETDVKVTYWHIPGGYDYINASVVVCWFDDKNLAERFCEKYRNPPEMACIG